MNNIAVRQLMGTGFAHVAREVNICIDDIEWRFHGEVISVDHEYVGYGGEVHWSVMITYRLPTRQLSERIGAADVPSPVDVHEGGTR